MKKQAKSDARVVNFEEPLRRVAKKEKKLQQQAKNKLWKAAHKSSDLDLIADLNPRHTEYYKAQLPFLVTEWDTFSTCLRQPLPATFRTSCRGSQIQRNYVIDEIQRLNRAISQRFVELDGHIVQGPLLSEVPHLSRCRERSDGAGQKTWRARVDNRFLSQCPATADLHQFVVRASELGQLVRQEEVSMLPAILLRPEAHHHVLDVCSAPGSKTEQILSLMAAGAGETTGFVMANDADPKRLDSLRRRFRWSPDCRLALVCADATELVEAYSPLQFDRVLCDVPCSGDGTFRKCPHLYRLFRPRYGLELHGVQLRIVTQALRLLRPGGRLVYSTCSLNPIEDEAVVAAALRHSYDPRRGALQPVRLLPNTHAEASELMPGLRVREGVTTWRGDAEVFCLGEDAAADGEADAAQRRAETRRRVEATIARLSSPASLLPPAQHADDEARERWIAAQLHNCVRVLHHDQDTGGFFVAVFERCAESDAGADSAAGASSAAAPEGLPEAQYGDGDSDADEEFTDGRSAMRKLGYNPKGSVSVLRRLEENRHTLPLYASASDVELFEPQTALSLCVPQSLVSVAPTVPSIAASFATAPAAAIDETVAIDVRIPPPLQASLAFGAVPRRQDADAAGRELVMMSRSLARGVQALLQRRDGRSEEQGLATLYDCGLRLGRVSSASPRQVASRVEDLLTLTAALPAMLAVLSVRETELCSVPASSIEVAVPLEARAKLAGAVLGRSDGDDRRAALRIYFRRPDAEHATVVGGSGAATDAVVARLVSSAAEVLVRLAQRPALIALHVTFDGDAAGHERDHLSGHKRRLSKAEKRRASKAKLGDRSEDGGDEVAGEDEPKGTARGLRVFAIAALDGADSVRATVVGVTDS